MGDSRFDARCLSKASVETYFSYYASLQHQQNMLQDHVRTGSYHSAIVENSRAFKDKVVVDVGAGTGILSLFAAMAGAKAVFAIEASDMALQARRLCEANASKGGSRVRVVQCKVEEFRLPEEIGKADVLISEPMGTLLVNERMLESYVAARDLLLKPDGLMFPSHGCIHVCPFYDELLHQEIVAKSQFWQQKNYFGLDLSVLSEDAKSAYFSQPVVDAISPSSLMSSPVSYPIDFTSVSEEALKEIVIPLYFQNFQYPVVSHGLACWFDVEFGSRVGARPAASDDEDSSMELGTSGRNSKNFFLTTAPGEPTTHWFQIRMVLRETLKLMPGHRLEGHLKMKAHSRQSYDVEVELAAFTGEGLEVGDPCTGKFDLKDPYYRQLVSYPNHG